MNLATALPAGWLLLVALAAGAGACAWAAIRRAGRLARALQQARAEREALLQALDAWHWRTDIRHGVVQWRPPRGAGLGDWVAGEAEPLWQHFQGNDTLTRSLRAALDQHAPLNATALWRTGSAGMRQAWSLRGEPVLDEQGRFAGYVGTARELLDPGEQRLAELLQALPSPVLRIALPPPGQLGVLYEVNAAAERWLQIEDPADLPAWPQLLPRLPAGLRALVERALAPTVLADAAGGTADGWELRVHRLAAAQPRGGQELLLLFGRTAAPAPPEGPGAAAAAAEQESFSYTVSHDLRAPIRVVEGFTKIVKEDYGRLLDRIGNDHLDRVLGAAARMSSMIDSLLALSQLSARPLARQPINLSQLVGYIVDDLRRQSPQRVVQVDIEPGLQAQGDATLLRVALENLLGNAWKYTAKCREAHIWFESCVHEDRPAFVVRDNGAGFDMRFADRLFGVFQRLHSANDFQGTGVGLASVRRIVRRHGGDIWAEGEVDRGARFVFWME